MRNAEFGYHEKSPVVTAFHAKAKFEGPILANVAYTKDKADGAIRSGAVDMVRVSHRKRGRKDKLRVPDIRCPGPGSHEIHIGDDLLPGDNGMLLNREITGGVRSSVHQQPRPAGAVCQQLAVGR
jgi:hypothetical protein